jgi:sulfofructose kinase
VKLVCLGWTCLDQRLQVASFPPCSSRSEVLGFRWAVGGPAAVGALAAARLGGQVKLLSRRADDPVGAQLATLLAGEGVEAQFSLTRGGESPVSAVLTVPGGERYIFRYRGRLGEQADWNPREALAGADAVLIDQRWPAAALPLADAARERGVPAVLDLDRDELAGWELAARCSHVIASEELARALGGVGATLERIASLGAWAAVTLGERGVVCAEGLYPAHAVEARDSTGAGDVFHGAFTWALAGGYSEAAALRLASAAAALHVQNGHPQDHAAALALLRSRGE